MQGGYRVYPPESLDLVLLIRNELASGFTLKELVYRREHRSHDQA